MDTSKEYIKMCERAEEIQKNWRPTVEDDVYIPLFETVSFIKNEVFYKGYFIWGFPTQMTKEDLIWLPRQDQLQEMIQEKYEMKLAGNYQMLYHLLHFADLHKFDDWSMEQLWLAFVMKEKYKKVWNGEKWERQK